MKRIVLIVLAIVLAVAAGGWLIVNMLTPPKATAAALDPARAELADRYLDLLDAGRWDDALAMTTPRMREGLGDGKLADTWLALPRQLGMRQSRSALRGEAIEGQPIVTATLVFPMLALDARVVFDSDNRISGFWLVPAQAPVVTHVPERGESWHELEMPVGTGESVLGATLTLPRGEGPHAAVVLVHGSGAHDRDETIGPNKPFRDLAHGLAAQGIAVLRYEKRTKAHPHEFAGNDFTLDDETTHDAVAAVAALRARSEIDATRVFVAGHSLGAMAAPRIAQRDPRIAGLILLAAPSLRLEDTVVRQMRLIAGGEGRSQAAIDAQLAPLERQREAVRTLSADNLPAEPMMLGLPARYWLDLQRYDPVASAREIAQPLLILQGERDYQVTLHDDFVRWQDAFADDARATLIAYPLLSHLFMPAGDPPGPKDYHAAARVDAQVIADIAAWIQSH